MSKKGSIDTSRALIALNKLKTDIEELGRVNRAIEAILADTNKIAEDLAAVSLGEEVVSGPVKDHAALTIIVSEAKLITDPVVVTALKARDATNQAELTKLNGKSKNRINEVSEGYQYFVDTFKVLRNTLQSFNDAFGIVVDPVDIQTRIDKINTLKADAEKKATEEACKLYNPVEFDSLTLVEAKKAELLKTINDDAQYDTTGLEKQLAAAQAAAAATDATRDGYRQEVNKLVIENFYGQKAKDAAPFSDKCFKTKYSGHVKLVINNLLSLLPTFVPADDGAAATTSVPADDGAAATTSVPADDGAAATTSLPDNIVWTEQDILDSLSGYINVLETASRNIYNSKVLVNHTAALGIGGHGLELVELTE